MEKLPMCGQGLKMKKNISSQQIVLFTIVLAAMAVLLTSFPPQKLLRIAAALAVFFFAPGI